MKENRSEVFWVRVKESHQGDETLFSATNSLKAPPRWISTSASPSRSCNGGSSEIKSRPQCFHTRDGSIYCKETAFVLLGWEVQKNHLHEVTTQITGVAPLRCEHREDSASASLKGGVEELTSGSVVNCGSVPLYSGKR